MFLIGRQDNFTYLDFIFVFLLSIIIPIIGTLSHEMGHYLVAKALNFNVYLHYSFVTFDNGIEEAMSKADKLLILSGGVLQTIFTSIASILLLFIIKQGKLNVYKRVRYILILFALFISRNIINFCVAFIKGIIYSSTLFGENSDERKISILLNLGEGAIPIMALILAIVVIGYIVLIFLYKDERLPFLTATFLGGAIGMYVWLYSLGEKLIP